MLCLFCGALHALAEVLQYGETLHIYHHAAAHMYINNVLRGHAVRD